MPGRRQQRNRWECRHLLKKGLVVSGLMRTVAQCFILALFMALPWGGASAAGLASDWVEGVKSRTRLSAGTVDGRLMAFVDVDMPAHWKTYWRNPGEAGGLPPAFDFAKSVNAARVDVLYPAPERISDKAGETLGYKERVAFPISFEAVDATKPVVIAVFVQYGICKDVCIPVDAELSLEIPPGFSEPADDEAVAWLEAVPRAQAALKPGDPKIIQAELTGGASPRILIEVAGAGDQGRFDVFLDAEGGIYVPQASRLEGQGSAGQQFEARLSAEDVANLAGKAVTVTVKSASGASDARVVAN